jgi:hypothetical protein
MHPQGEQPLGVDFVEIGRKNDSGNQLSSYLLSRSADKAGSLVEASMEHTTTPQVEDKVVAYGGQEEILQYIALPESSKPLKEGLSSAIAKVSEPVRLQLERRFTKVRYCIWMEGTYYYDVICFALHVQGTYCDVFLLSHSQMQIS